MALSIADQLLREKGVRLQYTNAVSTVGMCLMEYEVRAEDRGVRLKKADVQIRKIAADIARGVQTKSFCSSRLLARGHEKLFDMVFKNTYKKFVLEDSCVGCGKCVKVCPAGNIALAGKKPAWGVHCMSCHACVHWCPKNAVTLGKSKGWLTYHHPEISFTKLVGMKDK
ncbi:MAG: EFR1 family ferrodoxin [Tannerellaceae bacterium]|nr:EFR1 family ferrodoxin [Tannerellaceae bacterium]